MTQYLISLYQPDGVVPPPEFLEPVMQKLGGLQEEMTSAGAWVFSGGLHQPDTATVVRPQEGGAALLTDGPYVEAKEHVGGFWVVRADDLDGGLRWARKVSDITGLPVEIRPFAFSTLP
ncbi:YciI family protein [Naasia aerilata]|uniref:YCII-related domain-containing protein n=1 Tax=Naasia aerilata TaxID=1162966 RepID=A0ABN6XPF1_9MICO|nr:YciI family protein [Naasia aerilata]BDZ46872.1 hypothetical protein GCM10025866_27810 [Naasia aerilata]